MINTYLNIRMFTTPKTTAQGTFFQRAPNDNAFGKVFRNNMDRNSFGADMEISTLEKQLTMMISNSDRAIFYPHQKISETQKYKNCKVSKTLIYYMINCSLTKTCKLILDRNGLGSRNGINRNTNYQRLAIWNFYEASYF